MLDWLQTIGNFLDIIARFLVSFFTNVVELVGLVFKGFTYVTACIAFMPPQYQVVLTVIVCYSVIVAVIHLGG